MPGEPGPQVIRAGQDQRTGLVDGLGPLVAGAALGDHQRPDRLHRPIASLGRPGRPAGLRGPRRADRVQRIGLAVAAAVLPVSPDCLHDPDPGRGHMPGQARTVAAGALDADQGDRPEPAQPPEQAGVPGSRGRELRGGAAVVLRGRESRPHGEGRQRLREGKEAVMPQDAPPNGGAPGPAEGPWLRVAGIEAKLHRWAAADPGRRFDDLYNLVQTRRRCRWRSRGSRATRARALPASMASRRRMSSGEWACPGSWMTCELPRRTAALFETYGLAFPDEVRSTGRIA